MKNRIFFSKIKAPILLTALLLVSSCKPSIVKKTLEVRYINGVKDTIIVKYDKNESCNGIFFNSGCIYTRYNDSKYGATFMGCAVCGVRSYRVLN